LVKLVLPRDSDRRTSHDELREQVAIVAKKIREKQDLLPAFIGALGASLQGVADLNKNLLAEWGTLANHGVNFARVLGPVIGALKALEDGRQNGDDTPLALRELCEKLKTHLTTPDSLGKCVGLGLPLLVFWASDFKDIKNQLQFDCRGRANIIRNHATIEVGEIKASGSGFAKARQQLTLRVFTLKKIVEFLFPAIKEWVLIGRIFYSGHARKPQNTHEDISIYYHHMMIL